MYNIRVKYNGQDYDVFVFRNSWDKDGWDSITKIPRGISPEEFEAFQQYLEQEGFIEEAIKSGQLNTSLEISIHSSIG